MGEASTCGGARRVRDRGRRLLEAPPGIRVTTARLEPEDAEAFARDLAAALAGRSGRGAY